MNFKNLMMWAVIVFLTFGLYNMFKNPQNISPKNNIAFKSKSTKMNKVGNRCERKRHLRINRKGITTDNVTVSICPVQGNPSNHP